MAAFITGAVLITLGLICSALSVYGIFKFKFVLNRMHSAAINDTLSIMLVLLGIIVMTGFNFVSFKLLLIIIFLWMASPVSSHLISRLEVTTDEAGIENECEVVDK